MNNNENVTKLINKFNSKVNHIPDETDFQQYYSWTDKEDFIKSLLIPKVVLDTSITKDDYIQLINLVLNNQGQEYELTYWINILEVNLCNTISDLIFWRDEVLNAIEIYEKCKEDGEKAVILLPMRS